LTETNSIQARLLDQLDRAPHGPAIAFMHADATVEWRTRGEFHAAASGYAAGLQETGLAPGDVCVLVLPSQEFAATMVLAVLLAGGVPLLVAPPLLQGANSSLVSVLQRTVRRTRARLVICDPSLRDLAPQLGRIRSGTRVLFGEAEIPAGSGSGFRPVNPRQDAVAALQLTSGTTGFPRVCVWRHGGVLAALDAMAPAMKLGSDDICLNWTPLYHDMGLVNNYLLCMVKGVPLVMLKPHDFVRRPALWLQGLSATGATQTWSPNFGFAIAAARARDSDLDGVRLDHVKAFWNAAERIHLETLTAFHERFARYGVRRSALKTNFGCAENVGGATFSDPDGPFAHERIDRVALHERRVAVPVDAGLNGESAVSVVGVGRPAPGLTIDILSRTGKPLPDGRIGEIALRTPSRMEGYLGDAAATRRALQDGHLRTGDLGYMRGDELFWVGRVRERIAVAGKKFDPSDFERVLLNVPGLRPGCFAVFGVDDGDRGTQRIVVVSEVKEAEASDLETLAGDVRGRVSLDLGVELGEVVLVREGTLTKTSSGKRRHRYFRQLHASGGLDEFRLEPAARS
jgi:acyl-CoA synthetase (AMP-forming)/AMP-acid ligase II